MRIFDKHTQDQDGKHVDVRLLLLLFSLEPAFSAVGYFLGNSDFGIVVGSAVKVFLLVAILGFKKPLLTLLVLGYASLQLNGFMGYEGAKMYVLAFLKTIYSAMLFSIVRPPTDAERNTIRNVILPIFVFIACLQVYSLAVANRLVLRVDYESDAKEKNGYLISHAFGYYMAAFSMFFFDVKNYAKSGIAAFFCIALGRRTTLVFLIINVFREFYHRISRRTRMVLLVFVISMIPLTANNWWDDSLLSDSAEAAKITSGRSKLWFDYTYDINRGAFSTNTMIWGHGPSTSVEYNGKNSIRVWMHNDFFDLLYCLGFLGLVIYVAFMVSVSLVMGLPFFLYFFFAAFVNGFFLYCSYQIMFIFWATQRTTDGGGG